MHRPLVDKDSRSWSRADGRSRGVGLALPLFVVVLIGLVSVTAVSDERSNKWWWDFEGDPGSSHFVSLDQIDKSNVRQLEVAWFYPHGTTGFNPIVVDDVMYVAGRDDALIALDATSGKEIWIHEGLSGMTSRGVNYWQSEDGKQNRLFFAIDGYLQAIDARTGESIPSFGTDGVVDLRDGVVRVEGTDGRIQSKSPGKVWKNLLIMGSAIGEAYMAPPGDIRAYDVLTGKRVWQFHTVPGPGEYGYDTWPKDAYKYAGGVNNWAAMSIDEARGIVYLPTGSATYDFYGADRHGMNLFANSLLALDARTGKRLWHFQTIHHDLWDLDNVSAPQLVSVEHNGRRIDAVAHAGKTGFLYVFDRVTGEPLWPIEERPVPKSDVPGEQAWPTQPFPTKPPPFARQTFGVEDINRWLLDPDEYAEMRERVSKARNEGLYTPPALIDTISMPGNQGGSNWGTTAANPEKGLVYVLNLDSVAILKLENVKTRGGLDRRAEAAAGAQVYQQQCQVCHGALDGSGASGMAGDIAPPLTGVTDRIGEDVIRTIVTDGKGFMRPVSSITDAELTTLLRYLANPDGRRRRAGASPVASAFPPGPVVASGGAPLPSQRPRDLDAAPSYGGNGGNAGSVPYPPDVDVPPVRYMSDYGVMSRATAPPYTTLVAYDLNTATIKWQVPVGDDPATSARGGPTGTGGMRLRHGIVTTKTGLVFVAGGDGKVRAYDEDNGEVLWTGTLPGASSGIPVSYEAKGRQYVVFASDPRGEQGDAVSADTPRGYVAFALSRR
ncbi:MAG: PQQ-binding-like beta-propeller repeat protein [Luteitalea sp.]|nr:PQQ-binding-like beta-propeller repeat protein [Luteitalea sp.]